jgi:predicted dehydrogenase
VAVVERANLLSHPEIRVIAVESAVREHARDGLAVLEAGKHLHLEKAPADNLRDFERVVDLAARRKLLLQVGYMWRYHPGVEKMLEAAWQGWLGKVYLVKGVIGNQLAPERRAEWGQFPGGVMFDLGGHVIDPLVRLLGKPVKVTPFLRTDGSYGDRLRDNTAAVLEWPGALGTVQSATLQPGSSRLRCIEIHGTNGSAILQPIEPPELSIFLDRPAGPYAKGPQKISLPPYRRYADDFVELAAAVRGERTLRVSGADDLAVHETLLRASGMA